MNYFQHFLETYSFRYYMLLSLLIIPFAIILWVWNHKGHPIILPFDNGKQKRGDILRKCIYFMETLPAFLLIIAILIVSGPVKKGIPKKEKLMTNILFCLDVSGSMTSSFGIRSEGGKRKTKYDSAMEAMNAFINHRKGDAFGLSIFGNEVLHWVPVTKDTSAIKLATPFLRPNKLPSWFGGTQIGKALLKSSINLTKQKQGDRLIILISDGHSSDISGQKGYQVAEKLKEKNIVLYAIQIGATSSHNDLYTLATITGGKVFPAADAKALSEVFRYIDKMQKVKLKRTIPVKEDNFYIFAVIGMGILVMYVTSLFGLRYTPW